MWREIILENIESDTARHREAKRYFNDHGLKKLPKVKDLNTEFNALVAEKRAAYAEYRALRDEQHELLIHRQKRREFTLRRQY